MIQGPRTGLLTIDQFHVYSSRGWIVVPEAIKENEPEGAFVGIWSVNDNGDVPPRWKIGGPKSMIKKPRGLALDPKNKTIIVADMRLNAVLTFYFPEIF